MSLTTPPRIFPKSKITYLVRYAPINYGNPSCAFHPRRFSQQISQVPPHSLPECGHTFCQPCLEGWFNTTLVQHMAVHPNYSPNTPNPMFNGLPIQDLMAQNAQIRLYLQQMFPHYQPPVPAPQYTCPTCREPVKNRPVEDYALKSLVRTISGAAGEHSPKKSIGRQRLRVGRRTGTWDAFFRSV